MTGFGASLWAESLKSRRSKAPWLFSLGLALMPLAMGLFMLILKDPDWARQQGIITAKAQITGAAADWPTYVGWLAQGTAAAGFLIFGLIVIWIFGREHSDRTAKDLLALPTSRDAIVMAKFVVFGCWSGAATIALYLFAMALGHAIVLSGWSVELALQCARTIATVGGLTILLVTPLAWVSSAGRGYLPAIGAMFLVLALAQIAARTGWGDYFPWAIPGVASGAMGPADAHLGTDSLLIVALTGLAGILLTLASWRYADQT